MQGSPHGTPSQKTMTCNVALALLEQMDEVYAVDSILLKNHVNAT